MTRDQLDLRDKTMMQLMELDSLNSWRLDNIGREKTAIEHFSADQENCITSLLADRRQIRAAMAELRGV